MTPHMAGRSGKKLRSATATGRAPSGPTPGDRAEDADWLGERIRRIALGLTAALVVARAYWPAEGTTELETGQQLPWAFALLATIGTWLAAGHFRGRRTAAAWAAACLAFFALLGAALGWAMSLFPGP